MVREMELARQRRIDPGPNGPLRLLLVEDDALLRSSLVALFERPANGLRTAGAFGTRGDALKSLAAPSTSAPPQLALVDLGLPDGSGVDVIAEACRVHPGLVALAFTVLEDAANVLGAIRAGARGYVQKNQSHARLVAALHDAWTGQAPLSAAACRALVNDQQHLGADSGAERLLTSREREVLVILSKGVSYPEIARLLQLQLGTVQSHIKSIYRKLDISSKAEAAAIAAKLGLI